MDQLAQHQSNNEGCYAETRWILSIPSMLGSRAWLVVCLSLRFYVRYRRQRLTMLKDTFHPPGLHPSLKCITARYRQKSLLPTED